MQDFTEIIVHLFVGNSSAFNLFTKIFAAREVPISCELWAGFYSYVWIWN